MKIKPVILCGGAGTRLWPKSKKKLAKQFIDFGGWTLLGKTLIRIKSPIYDYPIISTNLQYLKLVRKYLQKYKIKKYKIILEPLKKNTAAAILSSTLLNEVSFNQPMIFFPSDHLIENKNKINNSINRNSKFLNSKNIFIFGIKPSRPSSQYGYFISKKFSKKINNVTKFIEKPKLNYAKKIIKKKAYWNSGIILATKGSIINNFNKYQKKMSFMCCAAIEKSVTHNNICYINKKYFNKMPEISFDYAILEKSENVFSINLNLKWSDLGSWYEISKVFKKNKLTYLKKRNIFYRPWGKYINLFYGKGFLVKELVVNPKSSISLQKHKYRSEYWTVFEGKPKITINNTKSYKKIDDNIFVPKGAIHRIENHFKKPVKIMEIQTGDILKETDITRYKDVYGRVN
tara:strand:+ start:4336 stop:5541 length:1206 start_codon:yes stop_codon:yes gene_type:complete